MIHGPSNVNCIPSFHFLPKSSFTPNVPSIRRYIISAFKNTTLNHEELRNETGKWMELSDAGN